MSFSKQLLETASMLARYDFSPLEAKRIVLYLSLFSCEITMKALLEKVEKPIKEIMSRSHRLSKLLEDIGECEIYKEITPYRTGWVRATEIRSITIDDLFSNATVGTLLTAEEKGASVYPNQIRYGDKLIHYPLDVMLEVAKAIYAWTQKYWDKIRLVSTVSQDIVY